MELDFDTCYEALSARDARFDGSFFVGVTSTGIYCRAVCPARTPQRKSCRFYRNAVEAERDAFRPCLRCRPELAPRDRGATRSVAQDLLRYLQLRATEIDSLEAISESTGYSARQVRRLLKDEFGVTPIAVLQTERLLFAKKLLQDTSLPVSEVALSAGFKSLRRFNASFRKCYRSSPSEWRSGQGTLPAEFITLRLAYRPPYAWSEVMEHFRKRAIPHVEWVSEESYGRVVDLEEVQGWLTVKNVPLESHLHITVSSSLSPMLFRIAARLRGLFDVDANPSRFASYFGEDVYLGRLIEAHPGLRLIGSWDPFEVAVRAVLGQQISVAAARTIAGRIAERWGVPVATPFDALSHAFPSAGALAEVDPSELMALGITTRRAETLLALARFANSGGLNFPPSTRVDHVLAELRQIPGIGEWTVQYIAMRAFRMPDAFPAGDLGLRKALGNGAPIPEHELNRIAENWRPWRGYAAAYLWQSLNS